MAASEEVIPSPPSYKGADAIQPPPTAETIPSPPNYRAPKPPPPGGYDWSNPETYKDPEAQKAMKEQSRQGGVLVGTQKPQSLDEAALQAVGAVPMMVGPWWAQLGTTAARSALRGASPLEAAVDVGGAATGLGALKIAGKAASKISGPAEALAWIRGKVGTGADASVNLSHVDRLIEWWRGAPNAAVRDMRGEHVIQELKEQFGKDVSQMFRRQVLRGPAEVPRIARGAVPNWVPSAARGVVRGSESDFGRAAVSALSGTPPASAGAVLAGTALPRWAMRHVPGGREISETIEEVAGENE